VIVHVELCGLFLTSQACVFCLQMLYLLRIYCKCDVYTTVRMTFCFNKNKEICLYFYIIFIGRWKQTISGKFKFRITCI